MGRKEKRTSPGEIDIPDNIHIVGEMLKALNAQLKKGTPELRWQAVRHKVNTAWQIAKVMAGGKMEPAHMDAAIVNLEDALSTAMSELDNKDGEKNLRDEITKLLKLESDLVSKRAAAHKASGDYVTRGEFIEEVDAIIAIIHRAIDVRIPNRLLASDLKNDIATGFARRRTGAAREGAIDQELATAELSQLCGVDGDLQAPPMAEDHLSGDGAVRERDGSEAADLCAPGVREVVPDESELSSMALGSRPAP